jgi:hypothetical protein
MRVSLLRPSDYQRTPWKNGLGYTDQIAIEPPGADLRRGDFLWRVSSARIERESPFSVFPNHDRVLVVLEGAGLSLAHTYEEGEAPELVELPPMEPYEFPGDVPTHCALPDGPIRDLSVFFAKGRAAVQAERLDLEEGIVYPLELQGTTLFLFVAEGELECLGQIAVKGETLRLEAGQEPPSEAIQVHAGPRGARAILIQIERA